jgi:2-iminobutanoate/2-iminopropanoate deaminase
VFLASAQTLLTWNFFKEIVMAIEKIETAQAPAAIGPYSQGVRAGDYVFFSGQIPLDPVTGEVVSGDIAVQTERVMANMAAVLDAAGLGFGEVVKTTIYLIDMSDFAVVNGIYGRYFSGIFPARATVQVAALPKGVGVEIEWIAYCGK